MNPLTHQDIESAQRIVYEAMQQGDRWRGTTVGVTLCGGNVDRAVFAKVLAG